MSRKPTPKPDDPEQSKRFIEGAKELGADEDADGLDRTLKKMGRERGAVTSGSPARKA